LDRQAADQAVAAFIEKYRSIYPTAIACLQRDLEACLTFYSFPKEHWKTIRTIMYNQKSSPFRLSLRRCLSAAA
jgi:transposase-like protein